MAGIGLYGVYYSKCTVSDGVVTGYGGVETMGKAISASFEPNESDNNPLYANNTVAENDASNGSGGTLTLTLDHLDLDAACDLYGLTKQTASVTVSSTSVSGTGVKYTGTETPNPVGVAFIRQSQLNDSRDYHEVVLFRRVTFNPPSVEGQTLGESIEWQTPEISGTVYGMEGDGTNPWYQTFTFPSQAAAVQYITDQFSA